jgi:membrane-bound ClpP family serine protease
VGFLVGVVVAVGAVSCAATSVSAAGDVRWVTGAILLSLLAATWLLCSHAGGHAWFVPVPALILAVLWAFTVSERRGAGSWWLVAMSAVAAAVGVAVAASALQQAWRHPALAPSAPQGASGTAVTPMTPVGVVRVGGETWTARSLSGPLPSGVAVHVVRVDGVRLDVWSEAGTVPDHRSLDSGEESS